MNINHHYRILKLPRTQYPYIRETSYCFCEIDTLNRDVYDLEPRLNIEDRVSILFTGEELEKVRPDIGVFEFSKIVYSETIEREIKTLKRINKSPYYEERYKKQAREKLEKLKWHKIIFVQIILVD